MQNVHGGQAELLNCVRVTVPPSRSIPTCGFKPPDPLSLTVTIRSSLRLFFSPFDLLSLLIDDYTIDDYYISSFRTLLM